MFALLASCFTEGGCPRAPDPGFSSTPFDSGGPPSFEELAGTALEIAVIIGAIALLLWFFGGRGKPWECTKCSRRFGRESELEQHWNEHPVW